MTDKQITEKVGEAMKLGKKQILDLLTDRPCAVCRFHKENGCSKWDCVFDAERAAIK